MSREANASPSAHEGPVPAPAGAQLPIPVDADPRRVGVQFWPKFWRTLGRIPFSEELAAAYYCARDPRTPQRVKGVLFAALGYFVVPTDLLPDFIAALGFTDDATVLATAMGVVSAHIKPRHQEAARRLLARPAPENPQSSD